jgi:hypothetical protein
LRVLVVDRAAKDPPPPPFTKPDIPTLPNATPPPLEEEEEEEEAEHEDSTLLPETLGDTTATIL